MFRLDEGLKVYLHREAVDFRKNINGLAAQQAVAARREQDLQGQVDRQVAKAQELETTLADARQALALATAQETLVTKIIAELGPSSRRSQGGVATAASRNSKATSAKRKVGA